MSATSTSNAPGLVVPPEVDADLAELADRSRRLGRWSGSFTRRAVLSGIGAAAFGGLAWWLAPGGSLSVHLPADLVAPAAGAGVSSSFESAASSLAGVMQTMGAVIATVSIVSAGYRVAFRGRDIAEVMPTFVSAIVIGGASTMATALLGTDTAPAANGGSGSTLAVLRDHVKDGLYAHVTSQMELYGGSDASKAYVLAQAALQEVRNGTADPQGRQRAAAHVRTVLEHLKQPTDGRFEGKTLYVLEAALLGKAASPPALAYYAGAERYTSWASGFAVVLGVLAAASGIAAIGLAGIAFPLRKRVRRIQNLLNRLPGRGDDASATRTGRRQADGGDDDPGRRDIYGDGPHGEPRF